MAIPNVFAVSEALERVAPGCSHFPTYGSTGDENQSLLQANLFVARPLLR